MTTTSSQHHASYIFSDCLFYIFKEGPDLWDHLWMSCRFAVMDRKKEILLAMFCFALMWVAPPQRACSITPFLTLRTFRELLAATCSLCWRQRRRCVAAIKSRILGTNSGQERPQLRYFNRLPGKKDINSTTVWVFCVDFIGFFLEYWFYDFQTYLQRLLIFRLNCVFPLDLYLLKRFR